jgi:hypothetical protein
MMGTRRVERRTVEEEEEEEEKTKHTHDRLIYSTKKRPV